MRFRAKADAGVSTAREKIGRRKEPVIRPHSDLYSGLFSFFFWFYYIIFLNFDRRRR